MLDAEQYVAEWLPSSAWFRSWNCPTFLRFDPGLPGSSLCQTGLTFLSRLGPNLLHQLGNIHLASGLREGRILHPLTSRQLLGHYWILHVQEKNHLQNSRHSLAGSHLKILFQPCPASRKVRFYQHFLRDIAHALKIAGLYQVGYPPKFSWRLAASWCLFRTWS